jgi:hypothetical protein
MSTGTMVPGEIVYVVYGDEPDLFHARLLTGHVVGPNWIVVSPTFDIFEEVISLENPDLVVVSFGRAPGRPPFGVRPEQLFGFNPILVPVQTTVLVAVGGRLAGLGRWARGVAVPSRPPRAPPVAGPPGPQLSAGGGVPGGGAVVAAPAVAPLVAPAAATGDCVDVGLGPSQALLEEGEEGPTLLLYTSPPTALLSASRLSLEPESEDQYVERILEELAEVERREQDSPRAELAMLAGIQRELAEQEAAYREASAAQTGSTMATPELRGHVSDELERDGGIEKNAREVKKEQAAQKNVKPGQGGGGDGAGHVAK